MGEEPNHTTASKPGPPKIIQYSLVYKLRLEIYVHYSIKQGESNPSLNQPKILLIHMSTKIILGNLQRTAVFRILF